MNHLFLFLFVAIAIENLADILTTVDFLDGIRAWWQRTFPRLARLAECKYCQQFWMSGITAFFLPFPMLYYIGDLGTCFFFKWFVLWLALHRVSVLIGEFSDRYLNRAPVAVHLTGNDQADPKI